MKNYNQTPTDEWIIDQRELDIDKNNVIGRGEYGIVYKAKWRGIEVAVKEFVNLDSHKAMLMMNEFDAMTKLHHPNIIQLLGYTQSPFMIVMEYMKNGSLDDYLKKTIFISLGQKIRFIMDICKGLAYLHARKPSYVIHRDIKTNNFLLGDNLQVKISDFGICKVIKTQKIEKSNDNLSSLASGTANAGTFRYMAPELILATAKGKFRTCYTAKVDIYSLGAVMYELFEGQKLFHTCESRDEFIQWIKTRKIPNFYRSPRFIRNLILLCMDHNPYERPSALRILRYLEKKKWWAWFYLF